jgi:hypothetical protein
VIRDMVVVVIMMLTRAVESVHETSVSFIRAQYVLMMVNLQNW